MLKEKGFKKGINLGGWFSQCDYSEKTMNEFITESDFEKIASWGIDHIRLPVDYNAFENNDGSYIESGFERISDVLSLCKKYSLKTIIDLHKTYGYSFDNYGESESGFLTVNSFRNVFIAYGKNLQNVMVVIVTEWHLNFLMKLLKKII